MTTHKPMSPATFQRALAAHADAQRGEHPSTDDLIAYHADTLDAAASERLQDHLALCRTCTQALLDLETFPEVEPVDEADRATAQDLHTIRRGLREALAAEQQPSHSPVRADHDTARLRRSLLWTRVAAALFCVTTIGLLWSVGIDSQGPTPTPPPPSVSTSEPTSTPETPSPPEPSLNTRIVSLKAHTPTRSGAAETIELSPVDGDLVVQLVFAEITPRERYRVRLLDARGDTLWSTSDLQRNSDGLLILTFDRAFIRDQLPDGRYTLHLEDSADAASSPLAEFSLDLGTP